MHIPDGFFDGPTSLGAAAVAGAAVAVAARRAGEALGDRQVPLAAVTAAFVFAGQMLNFPVAAGTSGHLIGGVLAAVLVGPAAGALCLTVVLAVQTLFADGGLTALGLNVVLMALVATLGGWALFRSLRLVLPRTPGAVVASSAVAAGLSVPLAALAFSLLFAVGGTAPVGLAELTASMVGVHVLIGVGEAVITATAVSAVLASRPDLVAGARDLTPVAAVAR